MIAVVDYGLGNVFSVVSSMDYLGEEVFVCSKPEDLEKADKIILPGVGAFPDCMKELKRRSFVDALSQKALIEKVPFLGICVGMQVLSSYGHEGEGSEGLGWFDSNVFKIKPTLETTKVPNVGWETVISDGACPLFPVNKSEQDFYFVHSYHMVCDEPSDITSYYLLDDTKVVASVQRDNIFGVQFHPEKSSDNGIDLLSNFLDL